MNTTNYKSCLEAMKQSSQATIKYLVEMYHQAETSEEKKLIREAYIEQLCLMAYAHFNLAWLREPDVFKHYPNNTGERESKYGDTY